MVSLFCCILLVMVICYFLVIWSFNCFTEEIETTQSAVDENAHQELIQELHKVQTEYEELHQRHENQIRDNTQLSR